MNLQQQTISGIVWSGVNRFGQQLVQIVISIWLARLLPPSDFGLVGMVAVFAGFAGLFADSGFGAALIQRAQLDDIEVQSVFWINITIGSILSGIFFILAPALAYFYDAPILTPIGRLEGLAFLIGAFGIVPRTLLTREMAFRKLARIDITGAVLTGGIGIGCALAGLGVWSLVVSSLAGASIRVALVWTITSWRAKAVFSWEATQELFGFSAGLLGFNAINYWARNLDNVLIGKIIGATALAIYARAYYLMLLPITQITGVISNVMFPALSSIQNDKPRVKSIYLRTIGTITLITYPAVIGLFIVADPLIPLLYGSQWAGVVPVFRVLCGASLIQAVVNPVGWIYLSQGRSDWMFRWGLAACMVFLVAIAAGAIVGTLMAITWLYLIANVVLFYPAISIPGLLIGMTFRNLVSAISGSLGCSVLMALIVFPAGLIASSTLAPWMALLVQILVGALAYLALIRLFGPTAYREIYAILDMRIGRKPGGHVWRILAPRGA